MLEAKSRDAKLSVTLVSSPRNKRRREEQGQAPADLSTECFSIDGWRRRNAGLQHGRWEMPSAPTAPPEGCGGAKLLSSTESRESWSNYA